MTESFWDRKKVLYPYHATTSGATKPQPAETKGIKHPYLRAWVGGVYKWGFSTNDDLQTFFEI